MAFNSSLTTLRPSAVKGQLVNGSIEYNTLPCRVVSQSTATLTPGLAVKLVADTASGYNNAVGEYGIDLAGPTDRIFGFVALSLRKNSYVAGDTDVNVVIGGGGATQSIIRLEAAAAIAVGAYLEINSAGTKVLTSAGTNKIVGQALCSAGADGDLVDVLVLTPLVAQL